MAKANVAKSGSVSEVGIVGGAAAGAAAGSFLGPVGAAIGAVVGGVAGSRSGITLDADTVADVKSKVLAPASRVVKKGVTAVMGKPSARKVAPKVSATAKSKSTSMAKPKKTGAKK